MSLAASPPSESRKKEKKHDRKDHGGGASLLPDAGASAGSLDPLVGSPSVTNDKKEKRDKKAKDGGEAATSPAALVDDHQFPLTITHKGASYRREVKKDGELIHYVNSGCVADDDLRGRWKASWEPTKQRLYFSNVGDRKVRVWQLPAAADCPEEYSRHATDGLVSSGTSPSAKKDRKEKKEKKSKRGAEPQADNGDEDTTAHADADAVAAVSLAIKLAELDAVASGDEEDRPVDALLSDPSPPQEHPASVIGPRGAVEADTRATGPFGEAARPTGASTDFHSPAESAKSGGAAGGSGEIHPADQAAFLRGDDDDYEDHRPPAPVALRGLERLLQEGVDPDIVDEFRRRQGLAPIATSTLNAGSDTRRLDLNEEAGGHALGDAAVLEAFRSHAADDVPPPNEDEDGVAAVGTPPPATEEGPSARTAPTPPPPAAAAPRRDPLVLPEVGLQDDDPRPPSQSETMAVMATQPVMADPSGRRASLLVPSASPPAATLLATAIISSAIPPTVAPSASVENALEPFRPPPEPPGHLVQRVPTPPPYDDRFDERYRAHLPTMDELHQVEQRANDLFAALAAEQRATATALLDIVLVDEGQRREQLEHEEHSRREEVNADEYYMALAIATSAPPSRLVIADAFDDAMRLGGITPSRRLDALAAAGGGAAPADAIEMAARPHPDWVDALRERDAQRLLTTAMDTMLLDSAAYCLASIKTYQEFASSSPERRLPPIAPAIEPPPPPPLAPVHRSTSTSDVGVEAHFPEPPAPGRDQHLAATRQPEAPPSPTPASPPFDGDALLARIEATLRAFAPAPQASLPVESTTAVTLPASTSDEPRTERLYPRNSPNARTSNTPAIGHATRQAPTDTENPQPQRTAAEVVGPDVSPVSHGIAFGRATPVPLPPADAVPMLHFRSPWRRVKTPALPSESTDIAVGIAPQRKTPPPAEQARRAEGSARMTPPPVLPASNIASPLVGPASSSPAPPALTSPAPPPPSAAKATVALLQWDDKRSGQGVATSHNRTLLQSASLAAPRAEGTTAPSTNALSSSLFYGIGTIGISRGEFAFEVQVHVAPDAPFSVSNYFAVGVGSKYFRGADGKKCAAYMLRSDGAVLPSSDAVVGVRYCDALPASCVVTVHLDLIHYELSFYVDGVFMGTAIKFEPVDDPEPLFPVISFGEMGGKAQLQAPTARLPDRVSPARTRR